MDILKDFQNNIEGYAESIGVDLNAYGQASPTKIILKAIQFATEAMQTSALVSLNEHNPLTATTLKSKLGLAYLASLNPISLMHNSIGYAKVHTNGLSATIKQYARLRTKDGLDYYALLPSETITITKDTEIQVCQGFVKTVNALIDGSRWQTIKLLSGGLVPYHSVTAYYDGIAMSIGLATNERTDAFLAIDQNGETVLIISNDFQRQVGKSLSVQYVDCLGDYGDMTTINTEFQISQFAYSGDNDISPDIKVTLSAPIIGGTSFDTLSQDLAYGIMLNSKNNLIGNIDQLIAYVKRFKQYLIQSTTIANGVLSLSVIRNIEVLTKTMTYWQATSQLSVDANDIKSLQLHLNTLSNKSTDLLIDITPARVEFCSVVINAKMRKPDHDSIAANVISFALAELQSRTYEQSGLYRTIMQNTLIQEMSCKLQGNTNEYGTASPTNSNAILIINAATITINGITVTYN
jgi:hypothetical protein